tara:strand:+ start:4437 stop:4619 length:183 start_codon:yes stop_codon:yes gene_type:complete
MTTVDIPIIPGCLYTFELPTGEFVRINLNANANDDWVVEHLDKTGEFIAGLQIDAGENNG